MSDRELLGLAAKAVGIDVDAHDCFGAYIWDPLNDDGDALRLAVKLCLEIDVHHTGIAVRTPCGQKVLIAADEVKCGYAATRRAITRAAAAIGEGMK